MNERQSLQAQPRRGFDTAEFEQRLGRAQRLMHDERIAALLLSTDPNVRYFSGFLTQFWQSPTRPWFLVVPGEGQPVAVIPEIGAVAMAETWIDDVRTWPAPRPEDDGVRLLAQTLAEVAGEGGRIALPMGHESQLRMPLADFEALRARLPGAAFVDATPLVRALRLIKSEAEIAKMAHICELVSGAFDGLPELVAAGDTERDVFRNFKMDVLRRGADDVPYLVGGAGPDGYEDIISPPTERELQAGDVLMLDTGSVFDGYFCDFDRNYAVGRPSDAARRAYDRLYQATEAGLGAARPGATCADVFEAMGKVLGAGGGDGDGGGNSTGRLGHGLGMQLTEWPSLTAGDVTVLQPGMVITLEPALMVGDGRMMVQEEDVVIREEGARLLTRRAARALPVIRQGS